MGRARICSLVFIRKSKCWQLISIVIFILQIATLAAGLLLQLQQLQGPYISPFTPSPVSNFNHYKTCYETKKNHLSML
jgi:hypothetical protein